jgi:hypothetical protein
MASKFDLNIAGIPGVAPKIAPVVVGFAEVGLGRSLGHLIELLYDLAATPPRKPGNQPGNATARALGSCGAVFL